MIALVDYGAGNLTSVRKALSALGAGHETPASPADLARAAGIIVPGVGHFSVTAALDEAWREAILERVGAGVPLFGICVGMQWLFEGSEEAPGLNGLGLMSGVCRRLAGNEERRLKVPHVGWNSLEAPARPASAQGVPQGAWLAEGGSRLLAGVSPAAQVYFTHSYAAPVTPDCVAATTHAEPFASAVERGHVFGVQFHPEKSGETGLKILRNVLLECRNQERRILAPAAERDPPGRDNPGGSGAARRASDRTDQ